MLRCWGSGAVPSWLLEPWSRRIPARRGGAIDIHVPKKDEGAVNNAPERWHFSASNKDFEKILLDATQEEVAESARAHAYCLQRNYT